MGDTRSSIITTISYYEAFLIIFYSIICGFWTMFKYYTFKLFSFSNNNTDVRDSPPGCLADTTLGTHMFVKLKGKGTKLHYVEAGNRGRPVLLLLHGFPDCWITWHNQIPVLSQFYRVIALDLKGFGDSDKPVSRFSYKIDAVVEEIKLFVSALGVSKCTIVGHDIGALFGWYLAHTNPDMIIKFVAISCPHPNLYWNNIPKNSLFNMNWIHFSQIPFLPEWDAMKNDNAIINECYQHLTSQKNYDDSYIDAYKYVFSRMEDWTGAINYYRNLPFYRLNEENLYQIDVPCLLIVGKNDPSVTLDSVVKSTEYTQKYHLKVIDCSGHYPHQQSPSFVNNELLNFLLGPPVIHKSSEVSSNPGLLKKTFGTLSDTMKYGNDVISNVRKDPNTAVLHLMSKALYFGKPKSVSG